MHELRETFRQHDDPEFQACLDDLHDVVDDGVAWDVILTRVVGLVGNDTLEHTTQNSLVNSAQETPCIARYKRSSPDQDDTVPQCHEINEDHLGALRDAGEEARILHAQAFVKQNGAKLKRDKGRHPIVLEYADLPDTLVLHQGLKVRLPSNLYLRRAEQHIHKCFAFIMQNLTLPSLPLACQLNASQIVITKNADQPVASLEVGRIPPPP